MAKKKTKPNQVQNPHDSLFQANWGVLENARRFLETYLPEVVLRHVDLSTLTISKDSFIDPDLKAFHSDILYQVDLSGTPGFVYVLFEHKSFHVRHIHLQLLSYMLKIWQHFMDQQPSSKRSGKQLPIIIPLLIYHGQHPWPKDTVRFSSLLAGPVQDMSEYIPDFSFKLYDLGQISDDQIQGSVMNQVVMLLFKYIFQKNLHDHLPDIFHLMTTLMKQDSGMQFLETILRYLFSTRNDIEVENLEKIVRQALSEKEGEYVMTLAEKLRLEGAERGRIEGKIEAIELGMVLKFPEQANTVMADVKKIKDLAVLDKIKDAIKTAQNASEIVTLIRTGLKKT